MEQFSLLRNRLMLRENRNGVTNYCIAQATPAELQACVMECEKVNMTR